MSANGNGNGDEIPGREIAYRLFAAEYDDASLSYAESDEERAPNYVISPTGARLNRVFVVGTLTEVTSVNDEMVRARIVDPTGAFVVYAGQYQPDELAFLEQATPPAFVAVTGKARTFQPDDSDQVYTSIRPESIAAVDADTRDRWVVSAAERTLERVGTAARAAELDVEGDALADTLREAGVESGLAAGIPLAQDHYGTTPSYLAALRDCALEAVEVVAGERDQVSGLDLVPDATSPDSDATAASLADLAGLELDALDASVEPEPATPSDDRSAEPVAATAGDTADAGAGSAAGTATSTPSETAALEPDLEPETETVDADSEAAVDETAEPETEPESMASEPASDEPAEIDAIAADTLETEDEGDDTTDDLGDFDAGDVDDGMYEMDEAEREQLEEEFGAEFTTGSEVDDPGEADIEVPDPDDTDDALVEESATEDATEQDSEIGAAPESGLDTAESDESEPETEEPEPAADTDDAASDDEPAADVDLEDYVVETMEELDDGDGADRTAVIETVVDDTGVPADEVEDAIQDALMGGQCYEPDDETLKAI
ncbi:RPA family protein [Natrinema hispanicum]|uniref:Rpa-associated protein n=1 Tax=Natrinema hispanicum TaxID=392421 RepID=A0A1G6TXR3_9EURY|nr:hypothetical protein [Natrinema hispanicum]SDD33868.1 hypothetical protein SAMN05192552_101923 [Natrinema hispanicum]SET93508.1 hypothetical protein SAMN04488694_11822 [Natrinema hispanicum]